MRCATESRAASGVIQVSARREGDQLVLTVRDDGPGLPPIGEVSSGVGLSNTRARLAALYCDKASLEVSNAQGGGVVAIVRLPYHETEANG